MRHAPAQAPVYGLANLTWTRRAKTTTPGNVILRSPVIPTSEILRSRDPEILVLRSENSWILPWRVILIRVVLSVSIESYMDWIDLGTLGPLEQGDSCNMGLRMEPKGR